MNNQIIYLDNNSTTQIDPRVLEAMMPFLTHNFANAASSHRFGMGASEAVETARGQVAELIEAETKEIIFTSGATEAINLAIKGVAENYNHKGKHIITVSTEHSAVLDTCKYLENRGFEVTYLPVFGDGLIDLDLLKTQLRPDTILVSVMHVNNETGVIQPIKEISDMVHQYGALFMTDATQSVGKISVDVKDLGIDLLSLSAHKIYGPKGVGVLYVRQGNVKIPALIHGGGHERSMRSGTLNVPGIVGLGMACEIAQKEMRHNSQNIVILRDELESLILQLPNTKVNGSLSNRIYTTSNVCFKGHDANAMIGRMKNIAVSNGSACTAAVVEPSHVLISMGLSGDDAFASIRFSLGKFNTKQEMISVSKSIKELISEQFSHA